MGRGEVILIAIISIAAITLYNMTPNQESEESHMFEAWKTKYNKEYHGAEHKYRAGVWMENYIYVKEHNAKHNAGLESYEMEMNEFADLTSVEFGEKYLMKTAAPQVTGKCTGKQAPTSSVPDSVDWETKGSVTPIKNQGQCGSCWSFSATGSLEGAHFNAKGSLLSFSEQNLVDCSTSYGNQGCNGGWMNSSFFYVVDNGIALESKYPYKGVQGKCSYNKDTDKAWQISDCTEVTADKEDSLLASIALNPVSVAIQANHLSFQLYKKGVYTGNCGTNLDHGVLAVGYGTESGKKYFKVKNSWGSGWGDKGFILIERTGDGKGKCGIQMAASYPIA